MNIEQQLRVEIRGRVMWLSIDREERRNAIDGAVIEAMRQALAEALLAMCDLAVASSSATFGLPEVKVGLFPAQVLSVLQHQLPRRVRNGLFALTDDAKEGQLAFRDKRKPQWSGR